MSSPGFWSMFAIFCQGFVAVILSWTVLTCRLAPSHDELHEVTLMKLLYLYDPVACGTTYFYNYTAMIPSGGITVGGSRYSSVIFWPERNELAASFRRKIRVWLSLHLIWCILGVANLIQRHRPCGFYITMIPFTMVGVAILVIDVVFAVLFYADASTTGTEIKILKYIDSNKKALRMITDPKTSDENYDDTSWIAVLFAYCSVRGVVPWFMNYWIVKDFYFGGLADYHRLHDSYKSRKRSYSECAISPMCDRDSALGIGYVKEGRENYIMNKKTGSL